MFSLAHELDPAATRRCPRTAVHRTPVGRHCCHRRIAVSNQPEADRVVRQARCGSAEHRPDEVVIEKRRSHGELRLFEREQPIMVPGRLPEHRKRKRMPVKKSVIRLACLANVGHQLACEQSGRRFDRLERPHAPEHFTSIVAGHSYRRDVASPLIDVQIRRPAHVGASITQVDSAFGVRVEVCEKVVADRDHLMRLPACASQLPRHANVCAVAHGAAEGVARQRTGPAPLPGHDHSRVESSGQRHPNLLAPLEVQGRLPREDFPQLAVVRIRCEG